MNFAKISWWWQWGWRETSTQESITILGVEINSKSIEVLEFYKMCVDSVIIWDKPNFEVRRWIWDPSKLVSSILHYCSDIALKSPIVIVSNGFQMDNESKFSSRFHLNIWTSSSIWVRDLYREIKQQIFLAMLTSRLNASTFI